MRDFDLVRCHIVSSLEQRQRCDVGRRSAQLDEALGDGLHVVHRDLAFATSIHGDDDMADLMRQRIHNDPRHFTNILVGAANFGFQLWLHHRFYYFFLIGFGVFTAVFLKVPSHIANASISSSSMRSLYLSGIFPFL